LYGVSPKSYVEIKTLDRTLTVGSTGSDVKDVQQYLKNLGYLDSAVDGSYGNATKAAAKIFQANEGLYVDGEIGNASYKVMQQTSKKFTALKKGMSGNAVKVMQTYLINLGYLDSVADGGFGTVTEVALKKFQSVNGLYADGEAGIKTLKVLYGVSPKANADIKKLNRTLKVGSTGSDVKEVQQYLKNLGYLDSVVDGSYGNATKTAAKIFQANENLYVDGEIGNASYKVMQQTGKKFSALKKGMNGNAVKVMQTYLIKLGYLSGTADGAFGSVTTNAVKRFQSVNGLYADGEAGLKTLTVLYGASPKQNVKTLDRTLKVGSTGADVKEVQQYLKNLGYLDSVVDGSYGNATKAAAIIFQSNERLYVDGEIGNASYKVMQQTGKKFSSLKKGMNGNAVKVMQTYLMKLGYLSGVADGAFGTVTENAVKRFQSMNGLYADGEAGLKTLTVLYGASPKQNVKVLGRTLKVGDTGSDVKEVQQYLKNLGYLDSVVDGSYGNATKAAAKIFQANESLYVDGEIGNASYKIMQQTNNKFSALKKGMNGNAVKVMQTYLIKLGYLGGTADGSLGSVTEAAIVRFQKDNGLYADGEAGLKTLSKLYLK